MSTVSSCKACRRPALLFGVNRDGMCPLCASLVRVETIARVRIAADAMHTARQTSNPKARLKRIDVAIRNLKALKVYADRGIPLVVPGVSDLLRQALELRRATATKAGRKHLRKTQEDRITVAPDA